MSADNTSYSVSFTDKPTAKPTKPDPEGAKMVRECIEILARSLALRKIADNQFQRIMEFHKKYEDKNPDDTPWQEKEKIVAEAEALMAEVVMGIKELKKLDDEYEALRQRVNRHYGKEVMQEHHYATGINEMYKEILEEESGDWWKQS